MTHYSVKKVQDHMATTPHFSVSFPHFDPQFVQVPWRPSADPAQPQEAVADRGRAK